MRLKPRLDALEAKMAPASQHWLRVFQQVGQSEEAALASHEAERGPIGDARVILRVFVNDPCEVSRAVG